jgi:VanZ family protein
MDAIAKKRRMRSLFVGLVLLVGLVCLSFLQYKDKQRLHTHGSFHLLGHFSLFAVVATLLINGVRSGRMRALVAAAMIAIGAAIELTQSLIGHQPLEQADIKFDTLGVIFGLLLVLVLHSKPTLRLRA